MAGTRKHPTLDGQAAAASPKRTRLIVRRGAQKRLDSLKQKTAHLQVDVLWDRRETERRRSADGVKDDRRKTDRRKKPAFTWDIADFAVVVDADSPAAE